MSRLARTNMAEAVARDMIEGSFRPVAMPVDVNDAAAFPEIARATASLAAKTPEERARLLGEWA